MKNKLELSDFEIEKFSFKIKPYRYHANEFLEYRIIITLFIVSTKFRSHKTSSLGIVLVDGLIDGKMSFSDFENPDKLNTNVNIDDIFTSKTLKTLPYLISYGLMSINDSNTYEVTIKGAALLNKAKHNCPDIFRQFTSKNKYPKYTLKNINKIME